MRERSVIYLFFVNFFLQAGVGQIIRVNFLFATKLYGLLIAVNFKLVCCKGSFCCWIDLFYERFGFV